MNIDEFAWDTIKPVLRDRREKIFLERKVNPSGQWYKIPIGWLTPGVDDQLSDADKQFLKRQKGAILCVNYDKRIRKFNWYDWSDNFDRAWQWIPENKYAEVQKSR
jgi:hypothetical protein